MYADFILNGQGHGEVGSVVTSVGGVQNSRFDAGLLRPYYDERGHKCMTVNTGRTRYDEDAHEFVPIYEKVLVRDLIANGVESPVINATMLRKEEWIKFDQKVVEYALPRLRAWSDLAAANTYGGFDGMSNMILEHETISNPGEAVVDMDGLTDGRNDAPKYQLEGLPLPITHSDFWISKRKLQVSRKGDRPLDTTMAGMAGRRVAEMVEKTLIGIETGATYGGNSSQVGGYGRASQVFGYLNFTNRLTKTNLTAPTGSNPEATVADVLAMRDQLYANNFFGPFMVYHSTDWDQYLDNDYARLGGNNASQTLRQRLRAIEGISDVRRLDYLTPTASNSHAFTLLMVQMTEDVARAVNGMDITTVQWESQGGMRVNFKVMCIYVPQLRADQAGQCGVLHARTA